MSLSKINTSITLEYLTNNIENMYFDRKSANYALKDLANEIASFANANGGILAYGITDSGKIEGCKKYGTKKFNDAQKVVINFLKPVPIYTCEIIEIVNEKQENDHILLFHIEPSMNYIVRNSKDEVYCRQGDSSIKLNHDQIRILEYDRKERNFETEVINESSIEDIDNETIEEFKSRIDTDLDNISVLKARGYLKEINGELKFTNAGMLLFGKNPSIYLPCSRLRVIKFEGEEFKTGKEMNVIKEKTFDKNLCKILTESREFINSQLREFSCLNNNGIFEKTPEYPEFAWYEGIVNAVTHRDYSNSGEQILVKIYNNRMEILSPGKLGGFVTVENMKVKRYSRNPQIARTLVEFGIVRELNEGVKRIYNEMELYNLEEPAYSEPDRNSVLLILNNNIEKRSNIAQKVNITKIEQIWNSLNHLEQIAIDYIINNDGATREEISELINRGKTSTVNLLNKLIEKNLIIWSGTTKQDSHGKYIIKE